MESEWEPVRQVRRGRVRIYLPPILTTRGALFGSLAWSALGVWQLALLGGLSFAWIPIAVVFALLMRVVIRMPDDR